MNSVPQRQVARRSAEVTATEVDVGIGARQNSC